MIKWHGKSFDSLVSTLNGAGVKGEVKESKGRHIFTSEQGAVVSWWPSTGTIQVQGKGDSEQIQDLLTKWVDRKRIYTLSNED